MLPDNPNDQARMFYLILLLLAISGGAFYYYRDRLGKAVRDAAAWVAIFAVTILAVSFWEPLKQSLMGDVPAQIDERTVVLQRGAGGHFFVTMAVNGTDVQFLVDTGASNLVLTKSDAARVGIETETLDYRLPARTANGTVYGAAVRLGLVELGSFVDQDVRAVVNGGDLDTSLLGMSYLGLYRGFEVDGDRFYLKR